MIIDLTLFFVMFFETEENLVVEICYYYGLKQSLVIVRIAIMSHKLQAMHALHAISVTIIASVSIQ